MIRWIIASELRFGFCKCTLTSLGNYESVYEQLRSFARSHRRKSLERKKLHDDTKKANPVGVSWLFVPRMLVVQRLPLPDMPLDYSNEHKSNQIFLC